MKHLLFSAVCLATSVFPFLPAKMGDETWLVCIGALVLAAGGFLYTVHFAPLASDPSLGKHLQHLSIVAIPLCGVLVAHTMWHLNADAGLPLLNQVAGWLILVGSAAVAVIKSSHNAGIISVVIFCVVVFV